MYMLYWVLISVCGFLSLSASMSVRAAFRRGQKVAVQSGLSGAEAAQRILAAEGLTGVRVCRHRGFLSDHYNPINRTLNLSPDVYDGRSASAVGVAAHEAGHAVQHANRYFPLWVRSALVPVANLGSSMGIGLIVLGVLLQVIISRSGDPKGSFLNWTSVGGICAWIGTLGFGCSVLFSLVTVPVEWNASARAKLILAREGILRTELEKETVSRVLFAAAMTYVAAAVQSILHLLYWLSYLGIFQKRSR